MKKNAFTLVELIAVIVLLCIIVLISFPALTNVIKGGEEKNKEEALNTIYMAAENYLMANYEKYFINNIGDTAYIYITDLMNNNYLNTDTVNPNNDSSFSSKDVVKITRNEDGTFKYELEYVKTLIETLLEQYSPSNEKGLLKDSTNENLYYYKGTNTEVANNFLWYGGHQWRVLEFNTNENSITLISQQPLTAIQPASAVWETKEAYESSYINTWLNDYFYNSLDSSIQSNILDSIFNVGIYTDVDEITTQQKVGLLDEEQYKRTGDGTTGKDSFLDIKDNFWLGNRDSSSGVRSVSNVGRQNYISPTNAYGVRAVIKISDLTITGGDGTLASNYQVGTKATNTNNVQIGEYINVPYSGGDSACGSDNMCTFRVVSKDSDSIKVVLNGLLPDASEYGSSSTISTNHTIYTTLNSFAEGISDTYRYTGNKTFYIGDYPYVSGTGQNYEDVQDETLQASVGLPTVGEMFSGNDIDLSTSSTKIFVDVNTIENPTVSRYYWTMNRSSSGGRYVIDGILHYTSPSSALGVRAVIYLKSGTSAITFTGGEGTAQSPYTLN